MRLLTTFLLLVLCQGFVSANNFYQNNNPFPSQTAPQQFNNIYETEPAIMAKEQKNTKKWFKKKSISEPEKVQKDGFYSPNEGINSDDSFIFYKNSNK